MYVKALGSGLVLWIALASSSYAAPVALAEPWLQRMQSAYAEQGYQGAFVYERKGAFTTHQVWRQVNGQGQLVERFLQLNGPAHEVIRINKQVTCNSAGIANERPATDIWPVAALDLQDLQQWYEVRVLGESRVAGQPTSVLFFSPRDQHRYAVELHLDQATAIPLKTLLLNEQGQLLERLEFVQFQAYVDPAQAAAQQNLVKPSAECLPINTDKRVEAARTGVDWVVDWVPQGFVLLNSHYQQGQDGSEGVLSRVYSDGLAHFSVFFENISHLEVEGGRHQLGPTAVVSRKAVQGAKIIMVTVVGEIPLGSAERIALSMRGEQEAIDD